MTEHAPRPDDEIVSAHLDGEATADEAARVLGHAGALDRLATFDTIRTAVAAPVDVESGVRERALAAALDVFDREIAPHTASSASIGPPPGDTGSHHVVTPSISPAAAGSQATDERVAGTVGVGRAPVDDLEARRVRRSRRMVRALSAAAAIVIVFGVLAATKVVRDTTVSNDTAAVAPAAAGNRSTTATTAEEAITTGQASDGASPTVSSTRSLPETTTTTAREPVTSPAPTTPAVTSSRVTGSVDLGQLTSRHELRLSVAEALAGATPNDPAPATTSSSPGGGSTGATETTSCEATLRAADAEIGDTVLRGTATYQGTPASVLAFTIDRYRFPAANGTLRIYAVGQATCAVLATETI